MVDFHYVRNIMNSVRIEISLTVRLTSQTDTKVGSSDPLVLCGQASDQRIKDTLGITGQSQPRVHIDAVVRHLDVDSSHPLGEEAKKGWAVRPLKRYVSWVNYDVSQ